MGNIINLEIRLLTEKQVKICENRLGNITINLETSRLSWGDHNDFLTQKRHFLLGNFTIDLKLSTSLSTFSKSLAMFRSSKGSFHGLSFQLNNRVSKFILFLSYVSKLTITALSRETYSENRKIIAKSLTCSIGTVIIPENPHHSFESP